MIAPLSLFCGVTLFIIGARSLPHPPATPEEVRASAASLALFFGGAYVLSGIFCLKLGKHGRIAVIFLSLAGLALSLYELAPPFLREQELPAPLVHGSLFCSSLLLISISLIRWQQKKRLS